MERIRAALDTGRFLDTLHTTQRQAERQITRPKMLYVLRHGWYEKRKDVFDTRYQGWNYASREKTVDGRHLRVVVAIRGGDPAPPHHRNCFRRIR